jgi:hypothetical protein
MDERVEAFLIRPDCPFAEGAAAGRRIKRRIVARASAASPVDAPVMRFRVRSAACPLQDIAGKAKSGID